MCSLVTVSKAVDLSVSEVEVRCGAMSSRVRASLRGPRKGSVMASPSEGRDGACLTDVLNPRQSLNIAQALDSRRVLARSGRPARPVDRKSRDQRPGASAASGLACWDERERPSRPEAACLLQ